MTQLLEQAFAEAQKLPEHEQNALASILLEEMLDERKWDQAFAKTHNELAKLGEEALAEYRQGKATPLKFKD